MQNTRKLTNLARLMLKRTATMATTTTANQGTSGTTTEQTTHFGYQTVKESEKQQKGDRELEL